MLTAARRGDFTVILVEDISRLWRNRAEFGPRSAELEDLRIHMITAVGDDTRRDGWGLTIQIKLAMAEHQRREASYRTKRGLEGRARNGKPTGGRAYGYIAARDSTSGERGIHAEQAETVRQIFLWYGDGKSPRWIAAELNRLGVPSPGASWNRTSERLNSKRKRGWVATAIHGDRKRGTGILNNRAYIGEIVWGRSTWRRSAVDSKQRRWQMADAAEVVKHQDERLRIVEQGLWNAVKTRQREIENATVRLRGVLKRNGRLPRHVLSGILTCGECGSTFRCVNGREYGCAGHRDGGPSACTNAVRIPIKLAERKLLGELAHEILSDEGVALFERRLREHLRQLEKQPKPQVKRESAQLARVEGEIAQLRQLMKAGTLSQAVAQAAIEKAEEGRQTLTQAEPERQERHIARVVRMLPNAARVLRERIHGGNVGLRTQRSILDARNTLFNLFGGKVPLRQGPIKGGEKPYLIARVGLNRGVLLEAAASCVKSGSGGRI